jgi:hypothetical protein
MVNLGQNRAAAPDRADVKRPETRHEDCMLHIQSHGHDALRRRRGEMSISRREFGVLGAAALAFRARHANAWERDVFVFGQDLPANLDPHQILDLGMTGYALNSCSVSAERPPRPFCRSSSPSRSMRRTAIPSALRSTGPTVRFSA